MHRRILFLGFLLTATSLCAESVVQGGLPSPQQRPADFAALGASAFQSQKDEFLSSKGVWIKCAPDTCGSTATDWGADSMTYAFYLYWRTTHDNSIGPIMEELSQRQPTYTASINQWSDVPVWDSIAQSRIYSITQNPNALSKAKSGFAFVDSFKASSFAAGACPSINYQQPGGGRNKLKTLETDANYVKAALLLYESTQDGRYLNKAINKYDAIRRYFLDPHVPLYTVYVFDDGSRCVQMPGRFYASVNGTMISNGYDLYRLTQSVNYRSDALETAMAVQSHLTDSTGIFVDLQAENDVVEPLVEAMFTLASDDGQSFARNWILTNADAMASATRPDGSYSRFFNGPANASSVTIWQTNGGYALQYAAAKIKPAGLPQDPDYWNGARSVPMDLKMTSTARSFTFNGKAIAIFGTLGEYCCEDGHARIFVDGVETFDKSGIWQNKSSSSAKLSNSILFAWRWPKSGMHTISIEPGIPNAKEGGSYFHMTGYDVVP